MAAPEFATRWLNLNENSLYDDGGALRVRLQGALSADASGVKVSALGITNEMLAGSIATSKLADSAVLARTDQVMDNFTAAWDFGTFIPQVQADPGNANDLCRKSFVEALFHGRSWKDPVRVVATAELSLTGAATIDGVVLADGDRVLATAQTSGLANGFWVVNTAGAWTRPDDFDTGATVAGIRVAVNEGTEYAETEWYCTNDADADVVDTNELTFQRAPSAGEISAGNGLEEVAGVFNVKPGNGILISGDTVTVDNADGSITVGASGISVSTDGITQSHIASTALGNGLSKDASDSNKLSILLDGGTLSLSTSGIKVAGGGITGTELNASVSGAGLAGGDGSPLSVGSGNGISVDTNSVGLGSLTSNWNVGDTFTITNLPDPTNDTDAATKHWVRTTYTLIKTEVIHMGDASGNNSVENQWAELQYTPSAAGEVRLWIRNAPNVTYNIDFAMDGSIANRVRWDAKELSDKIISGDYLTFSYPITIAA